jgi:hypothetical protein
MAFLFLLKTFLKKCRVFGLLFVLNINQRKIYNLIHNAMIDYITFRKSNASKLEVLILKVIALSMLIGLIFIEFTATYNCL